MIKILYILIFILAHMPPGDIAAQYYPLLGPYSSNDETVMENHLKWLSSAGIDVLSVSWYPPGMADEHGKKNYCINKFKI